MIIGQDKFTHTRNLCRSANLYYINMLQVLTFIHNIKPSTLYWIFLHPFETTNHTK